MLYTLLAPLGKTHLFFNLFTYISFRAAGAMVTALLIAFALGPWIIGRLRALKGQKTCIAFSSASSGLNSFGRGIVGSPASLTRKAM